MLNRNLSPGKGDTTWLIERTDHAKRESGIPFDLMRIGQYPRQLFRLDGLREKR